MLMRNGFDNVLGDRTACLWKKELLNFQENYKVNKMSLK